MMSAAAVTIALLLSSALGMAVPVRAARPLAWLSAGAALALCATFLFLLLQYADEPRDGGPQNFREALPTIAIFGLGSLGASALGAYEAFRHQPGLIGLWAAALILLLAPAALLSISAYVDAVVFVILFPGALLLVAAVALTRERAWSHQPPEKGAS